MTAVARRGADCITTRRAVELGITQILTGNDLGNAPMLAINAKLG